MRGRLLFLSAVATLAACSSDSFTAESSDSGQVGPGDGGEGDGGGGGDAGDGSTAGPTTPASVTFVDQDPSAGKVTGDVKIARAPDESSLTHYTLYWSKDGTAKLGAAITTLAKTGGDLTYSFAAGSPAPADANFILAFTGADSGENLGFAATAGDNYPHLDDVGTSTVSQQTFYGSTIFIEPVAKKLGAMSTSVTLFCDLPFGACTQAPMALAANYSSGEIFETVFDSVSGKIISLARNNSSALTLITCAAEGTGCTDSALSPSLPTGALAMTLDDVGGKIYIFGVQGPSSGQIEVCSHDGTGCAIHALSANTGPTGSYKRPRLAIDPTNHILAIAVDDGSSDVLTMLRCPLSFGATDMCSTVNISNDTGSGLTPSIVVDAAGGKVAIVSEYFLPPPGTTTSLIRCNLDGTACAARANLSAGVGVGAGLEEYPSAVFDPDGQHLYVGVSNSNLNAATMYRCNPDGSACSLTTLSPAGSTGGPPTLRYDTTTRRIYFGYQAASALALGSIATW